MRRRMYAAALVLVTGCGRLGFDTAEGTRDGPPHDDGATDASPIPAGAVLWAPMDSIAGTDTTDAATGHVIHCVAGVCPTPTAGHNGGALHFNGSSMTQLTVDYRADLDPSAAFTVATWLNLDAYGTTGYTCLVSKPLATTSFDSYSLCLDDTGQALYFTATTSLDDYTYGPTITLGTWHHLAMTWDGATKYGYLDGALVATKAVTISVDTSGVVLAGDNNGGTFVYQPFGSLDDVVIYGRALDATEIAQLAR